MEKAKSKSAKSEKTQKQNKRGRKEEKRKVKKGEKGETKGKTWGNNVLVHLHFFSFILLFRFAFFCIYFWKKAKKQAK